MKVGLIADLHGNSYALAAVLAAGRKLHVEQWLCAGDYVGYYYDAEGVFSLLDSVDWIGVRGNHDSILTDAKGSLYEGRYVAKYGSAIIIARTTLHAARLDVLDQLPEQRFCEIDGRRVLICHGSPWDPDLYIYPDASAKIVERLFAGGECLVLMGHTHYPAIWQKDASLAVNPGSVGQPRDRIPGACWALWDTRLHTIEMRRESYDMADLIDQCRRRDPSLPYLVDVLVRRT